jgi:hypothetical protein
MTRVLGTALLVLAAHGCANAAHRDFVAARTRFEQCVAAAGAAECAPEHERMLAAERAYQEAARRGWGCDPAHPDCPTPR